MGGWRVILWARSSKVGLALLVRLKAWRKTHGDGNSPLVQGMIDADTSADANANVKATLDLEKKETICIYAPSTTERNQGKKNRRSTSERYAISTPSSRKIVSTFQERKKPAEKTEQWISF
jgi:hypothetical protein